jgi:hypothetical protein
MTNLILSALGIVAAVYVLQFAVRWELAQRRYQQRVRLRAGRVREDIAWAEWLARNGWR